MGRNKNRELTKRQRAVLEALSTGDADEISVLKKYRVSTVTYREWLGEALFSAELNFRMESARRQGAMLIARNVSQAAERLMELMEGESPETARKACMDIIKFGGESKVRVAKVEAGDESEGLKIGKVAARRILAIVAESERSGK